MPPIKSENLFKSRVHESDSQFGSSYKKDYNLAVLNERDRQKFMAKILHIDVNDPRNEYLLKDIQDKNEHLNRLLDEDSKIPLFNIKSFRHQLLVSKLSHIELTGKRIPIYEDDIVQDEFFVKFLDKFCR